LRESGVRLPGSAGRRLGVLLALALGVAIFFILDLDRYLSIAEIKAQKSYLSDLFAREPVAFAACFLAAHILLLALCVPGAVLTMSLAAGAIFGLALGATLISLGTLIGSALALLAARYLARDWVKTRFARQMVTIDRGVKRDGILYLLALRLTAIIPYFIVNLAMGLTQMRLATFAAISFIGLLPSTILYVNAGTELAKVESASDILSLELIGSFILLALLPFAAKYAFERLRPRRAAPPE
jgi:uncharacterized membrane protein YdjX (TVP38/TMEM64 family)